MVRIDWWCCDSCTNQLYQTQGCDAHRLQMQIFFTWNKKIVEEDGAEVLRIQYSPIIHQSSFGCANARDEGAWSYSVSSCLSQLLAHLFINVDLFVGPEDVLSVLFRSSDMIVLNLKCPGHWSLPVGLGFKVSTFLILLSSCLLLELTTYKFLYIEIIEGEGSEAQEGDTVEVNYVCRRSNGYFVHRWVLSKSHVGFNVLHKYLLVLWINCAVTCFADILSSISY